MRYSTQCTLLSVIELFISFIKNMNSSKMLLILVLLVLATTLTKAACDDPNVGPTIVQWPNYNPQQHAQKLGDYYKAGDTDKFMAYFVYHAWWQRVEIVKKYNTIFPKHGSTLAWDHDVEDLLKDDKDAGGNMKAMGMYSREQYLAYRLRHSFNENSMFTGADYAYVSILCTSRGDELRSIIDYYQPIRSESLANTLGMEAYETLRKFLEGLLYWPYRTDAKADDAKTANYVKSIPEKKGSCDKDKNENLYNLMQKESYDQIKAVGLKYEADSKTSVIDKIKLCKDDLGKAFTIIMYFSMKPADYFAEELNNYITDQGDKNHNAGPRIILTRSDVDLAAIRAAYKKNYKADLDTAFKGKLGEANQKLMKFLIDGNRDPKVFDAFK